MRIQAFIPAIVIALCVSIFLVCSYVAPVASQSPNAPKRLLLVTHTAGYRHACIPTSEKVIEELGKKTGLYTIDYCRTAEDVKTMLTGEALRPYDGVFFDNTSDDLPIPDLDAFLGWIKAGKVFIGAHGASATYKTNLKYQDMIGAGFKQHGKPCEAEINVEEAQHPAVKHLAPKFTTKDEIYEFKTNPRENPNDKVMVLLSMNRHPNDGHKEAGQPGDFPLAWCKTYGQGRVFYTALGHFDEVWESERYQQHLLGGIRWAFNLPAP